MYSQSFRRILGDSDKKEPERGRIPCRTYRTYVRVLCMAYVAEHTFCRTFVLWMRAREHTFGFSMQERMFVFCVVRTFVRLDAPGYERMFGTKRTYVPNVCSALERTFVLAYREHMFARTNVRPRTNEKPLPKEGQIHSIGCNHRVIMHQPVPEWAESCTEKIRQQHQHQEYQQW